MFNHRSVIRLVCRGLLPLVALVCAVSLLVGAASPVHAQCSCGSCDGSSASPFGTVYTDMIPSAAAINSASCESCSARGSACACGSVCGSACEQVGNPRTAYLGLFGGLNWVGEDEFQTGGVFGVAVGRQFGSHLRVEVEGTYRGNVADEDFSGQLDAYSGMLNFVFELPKRRKWNGYGGVGIGAINLNGQFRFGRNSISIDDATFAYQVFGGLNRQLTERVSFFGEYRFLAANSIELETLVGPRRFAESDYFSNSLLFGLRFFR